MVNLGEWLIGLLILAGSVFALIGSIGLASLPDFFMRLHGPTKASTLGIGSILVASSLYSVLEGPVSLHELLISLFLFMTAPITAHLLAKSALHYRLKVIDRTRGQDVMAKNRDVAE